MSYIRLANGTVWPHPRPMTEDQGTSLEWRLRRSKDPLTRPERLVAASVLEAYRSLIMHPFQTDQHIARIVGEIREKLEKSQ